MLHQQLKHTWHVLVCYLSHGELPGVFYRAWDPKGPRWDIVGQALMGPHGPGPHEAPPTRDLTPHGGVGAYQTPLTVADILDTYICIYICARHGVPDTVRQRLPEPPSLIVAHATTDRCDMYIYIHI